MQEELEEQELFNTRLELLEKETMNNQNELEALNSADCLKVGQNSYHLSCTLALSPLKMMSIPRFTMTHINGRYFL